MSEKILVVDDNEASVKDLIDLLRSNNKEVIYFINYADAMEYIKKNNDIKVFIIDLYLTSGIDGMTLSEKIRKIDSYKNAKIFIHTSEKSPIARDLSKNLKIDGWIVKPCNPKVVLDIIKKTKMVI
ncbi:MAG: response regulator [Oligoflexia bacterium]|nr:response regulator [Oligoflexia bacterium]